MEKSFMIRQNEIEEIVRLINSGFDINLLSFELDIPIEQLKAYVDRTNISEEELPKIESEKEEIDFSEDIDETLNEFQSQKPRRKSSNLRKNHLLKKKLMKKKL